MFFWNMPILMIGNMHSDNRLKERFVFQKQYSKQRKIHLSLKAMLDQLRFDQVRSDQVRLGQVRFDWVRLDQVRLGQVIRLPKFVRFEYGRVRPDNLITLVNICHQYQHCLSLNISKIRQSGGVGEQWGMVAIAVTLLANM